VADIDACCNALVRVSISHERLAAYGRTQRGRPRNIPHGYEGVADASKAPDAEPSIGLSSLSLQTLIASLYEMALLTDIRRVMQLLTRAIS